MGVSTAIVANWPEVRKAFIEREIRPTFEELSKEFSVSAQRIGQIANDEAWGIVRAERIEQRLQTAEIGAALVARISGERTILDAAKNSVLTLLQGIGTLADELKSGATALTTRSQVASNLSFAILNCCNALKAAGVLSPLGKLKPDGGNPADVVGFLQSINVTVNAERAASEKPVEPAPFEVG